MSLDQFWVKEDHRAPLLIALIGPIEYWWDTPDDPDRFNSLAAALYRCQRSDLSKLLTENGYLVYRPHEAFKGGWDERAQVINDAAIITCDVVVDMTPTNVPMGKGTAHERAMALDQGIPVYRTGDFQDLMTLLAYLSRYANNLSKPKEA